jgi:hypothetical protein
MPYFGNNPSPLLLNTVAQNGKEMTLDADADTSITADTDDQIDIKIGGADDFQFTANTFTAQSGSTIAAQALTATTITTSSTLDVNGNEIILDADADTSITADTDDQIDFKCAGIDRVIIGADGSFTSQPAAGGTIVFNEASNDVDFRVESNNNTHMLFVDGGNDALAVGTSSADTNATMTVSNTGDNHAISIVGALNKSRMHFQGANTGSASTDGLVIGLSSSDDTNDDSALIGLKESGSLTLQTNNTNHLIIDGNGHVTMPKQSCFHVKGSTQYNVPKNAVTDIQFNSERFDLNGDFDTSTYTFTAPVTGKYQINIVLRYDNGDMDNSYYSLYLNTSNSNYRPCIHSQLSFDQDVDYFNMNGALVIDMDANDTAKVQLGIPNLGADQVDLELPESVFSGYLVA